MKNRQRLVRGGVGMFALGLILSGAAPLWAQQAVAKPTGGVQRASAPSLDQVPVPRPSNLASFVKNEAVAVQLGKALLWDQQVGSDGRTACATCHHAAGVDSRRVNTMNPGRINGTLDLVPAGGTLRPGHFPVQGDDVVGSQGVVDMDFVHVVLGNRVDTGLNTPNPVFGPNPQVTGRQAPTYINAIYNELFFWDGRAANTFDGNTVGNAGVPVLQASGGTVVSVPVQIDNASAASQAVGPPNSDVEMAWAGRTFPDIGKKMLRLRPLATQSVHPQDSILDTLRQPGGNGLRVTYSALIRNAFVDSWWDSNVILNRAGQVIGQGTPQGLEQFSLMEFNFALFWGLAVQMYEASQISPNAPFDRFIRGDSSALTARQQLGMDLFFGDARCNSCHGGAEFTNASVNVGGNGRAFANIGVEPLTEDPGNADGEFKVPTLRNVELTGPYFHNGKYLTLRQVVDFYDRGGDVPNDELQVLGLTNAEKDAVVDFLIALTDPDVRFQRGLFDHPSLNPVNRAALPAVGRQGLAQPLTPFLGVSPFNPGP